MSFDEPEGLDRSDDYNEPEYDVIPEEEDIKITKNTVHIKNKKNSFKAKEEITEKEVVDEVKKHRKEKKESKVQEPKPYPKGRNDFEQAKKMLQRNQYNTWEDPKNHYCDITIPKNVTLGEDLVVKLSKKVKKIEYVFGDGYTWKKTNVYNPDSEFDISLRPTVSEKNENFNDDKIVIKTGAIKKVGTNEYQMWLKGFYYLSVRCYDKEWHEDAVASTMVELV